MASDGTDRHPFGACAHCGAPFEPEVSYPVETRGGADRELELYSFCGEDCRAAWTADD